MDVDKDGIKASVKCLRDGSLPETHRLMVDHVTLPRDPAPRITSRRVPDRHRVATSRNPRRCDAQMPSAPSNDVTVNLRRLAEHESTVEIIAVNKTHFVMSLSEFEERKFR